MRRRKWYKAKREQLDEDDLAVRVPTTQSVSSCPTGKVIIRRYRSAQNIAKSMCDRRSDPFIEAYHCDDCGFYHVGHVPGTQALRREFGL